MILNCSWRALAGQFTNSRHKLWLFAFFVAACIPVTALDARFVLDNYPFASAPVFLSDATKNQYQIEIVGNTFFTSAMIKERMIERIEKSGLSQRMLEQLSYQLRLIYRQAGFEKVDVQIKQKKNNVLFVQIHEGKQVFVDQIEVHGGQFFSNDALLKNVHDFIRTRLENRTSGTIDKGDIDELLTGKSSSKDAEHVHFMQESFGMGQLWQPYDNNLFAEVKTYLHDLYYDSGFLDVRIFGPKVTTDALSKYFVKLSYRVEEGPQILVNQIDFEADAPILLTELIKEVGLKKKDPINGETIENLRAFLEEALLNQGYPFAKVESKLRFTQNELSADIIFLATAGQKVEIAQIELIGNLITKDEVILRRLSIHPQDLFSLEKINESRSQLLQTDLFHQVDIYLDPNTAKSGQGKLIVKVIENGLTIFEMGAGVSLVDGPRLMGVVHRRNLLGLGIDFHSRMQLNYPALFYNMPFFYPQQVALALENRFSEEEPWLKPFLYTEGKLLIGFLYPRMLYFPYDTDSAVDLSIVREIKPAYNANKLMLQLSATSRFNNWLHMVPQVEIEYANFDCPLSSLNQGCLDQTLGAAYRLDRGIVNQMTLNLLTFLEQRDSAIRPKQGYLVEVNMDFGMGSGDLVTQEAGHAQKTEKKPIRYFKFVTAFSAYVPLLRQLVWSLSAKVGSIHNLLPDGYVPLFKRFYLGGTSTVRGFFEDQILPADDDRVSLDSDLTNKERPVLSLGGQFFALMRNEIRFPLYQQIEGAVFVDIGELLIDPNHWSFLKVSLGCGVGIRYQTPIGPLLFDLGVRALDRNRPVSPRFWQLLGLHFAIGY